MIIGRNTTVLASNYQSTEQMKKFIKHCTGAKLTSVRGNDDAFWVSGDQRGNYSEHKYYKIVFGHVTEEFRHGKDTKSGYGFDIQSTGDYNGWEMMGSYRGMIKEAMAEYKNKNATKVDA